MLDEVPEPSVDLGAVLVEALAVGVCGTDAEIASGAYGWAPPGEERLILGHESLGRVIDPGPTGLAVGDHVVGIVRRPDPTPCASCAVGEWDMCSNGGYTERGIKQMHGFMSQRWRIEPEYVVRVDAGLGDLGVLLEPTTVVAKAWEQIIEDRPADVLGGEHGAGRRCGADRAAGRADRRAARQRGPRARPGHDRSEAGAGRGDGGQLSHRRDGGHRVVVRTSSSSAPASSRSSWRRRRAASPGGIVCLTGIGPAGPSRARHQALATEAVLKNLVMFGSVNANRRNYYRAAKVLAKADRVVARTTHHATVRPDDVDQALARSVDDIKVVVGLHRDDSHGIALGVSSIVERVRR